MRIQSFEYCIIFVTDAEVGISQELKDNSELTTQDEEIEESEDDSSQRSLSVPPSLSQSGSLDSSVDSSGFLSVMNTSVELSTEDNGGSLAALNHYYTFT